MGGNRKSLVADLFWDKSVCEAWKSEMNNARSPRSLPTASPPPPPHPPSGLDGAQECVASTRHVTPLH